MCCQLVPIEIVGGWELSQCLARWTTRCRRYWESLMRNIRFASRHPFLQFFWYWGNNTKVRNGFSCCQNRSFSGSSFYFRFNLHSRIIPLFRSERWREKKIKFPVGLKFPPTYLLMVTQQTPFRQNVVEIFPGWVLSRWCCQIWSAANDEVSLRQFWPEWWSFTNFAILFSEMEWNWNLI